MREPLAALAGVILAVGSLFLISCTEEKIVYVDGNGMKTELQQNQTVKEGKVVPLIKDHFAINPDYVKYKGHTYLEFRDPQYDDETTTGTTSVYDVEHDPECESIKHTIENL
jgi:hypothetical protein